MPEKINLFALKVPSAQSEQFINEIIMRSKRTAQFMGYDIIVNQGVFPVDSQYSFSSMMLACAIPENAGKVLDIGTGTGVQAIIASTRGAERVVAIDIDKKALENARENVAAYNLSKKIEVRESDIFINIGPKEKFDLIMAQLPFEDANSRSSVGHLLFDLDFRLHERLLREAKLHLSAKGRIMLTSGSISDEERLLELIDKYRYEIVQIIEKVHDDISWSVYTLKAKTTNFDLKRS